MNKTDTNALISQAVSGDADAFRCLAQRYYMTVYKIAYKWCGRREEAEDIAQEVFIKLPEKLESFRGEASFTTWLYRLIGYESRLLNRADFNNDKVDAGDIGSGHAVTANYEITPAGSKAKQVDALRYQKEEPAAEKKSNGTHGNEYAFLKIRYKLPSEEESRLITTPITPALEVKTIAQASDDTRFATAVAAFGQLLKADTHIDHYSYDDVLALAEPARGKDTFGYRAEFLNLVRLAKTEQGGHPAPAPMGVDY